MNFIVANILVLILYELAHGLAYWFFSRARPRFGVQGLAPYAAAPLGIYTGYHSLPDTAGTALPK